MPNLVDDNLPTQFPKPDYLTLSSFKRGVITLLDKSRLPKDSLEEAENVFLVEDGQPAPRPGINWYGASMPSVRKGSATVSTNIITNPNFETNATSWSGFESSVAKSSAQAFVGTSSLLVTRTTGGTGFLIGYYSLSGLTIGLTYQARGYVFAPLGAAVFSRFSSMSGSTVNTTGTGAWQEIVITGVATATTDTLDYGLSGVANGTIMYIDTVLCEQTAGTLDSFFDGATTDTSSTDFDWTGTANASTSTKSVYTYEPYAIDGFDYYDTSGTIHIVSAAGGIIYRSLDNGTTWTACTGVTYTAGTTVEMNQYNSILYITNGTESPILYDGTTVLTQYATLATPAAPTIVETGLAGAGNDYYYKCARVNAIGFSAASPASAVVSSTLDRTAWDTTTNFATLTVPALVAGQIRTDIYLSTDNTNFYYLGSTSNTIYIDDGSAFVVPSTTAPSASTAQGPRVKELVNVGSRMYGTRDTDNPYRIWFTSGSPPLGAFSSAFDGGYLEWGIGGKYRPLHVEDYRDGKGTPLATIWCDSADGQGCIIQMSLDTLTISDISITVPSAYKLPGSRGTPAPRSVINVLNDYFFYNSQAIYNLGSRAQFLNLLSTDEASANIRPTVKQITTSVESKIASAYFDAKVYFSVPRGSSTNNYTMIFDTERKAWLPSAFTIGFSKFLRYIDTSKVQRLLCLKPGDTRLSEINDSIQGDYGVAFTTSVKTGLLSTTSNRAEFQFIEQAECEFSNPQGAITVELLGVERSAGFTSNKTATITPGGTRYGWDSFLQDTTLWDDTTLVEDPFSESSVWRYFTVQKELRSVQWRITTNSLDAYYRLRTLQTWGTETQGGMPRPERLV